MPLRIGIIGAGANTRERHIPGLQAIDGVEVVSVCNRSQASSERVAEQFGIQRIHEEWQDLIRADDIDAIVIGTWPNEHCRLTVAALMANKHVLCEARMAANARQAHLMRKTSRARPHLVAQIVPSPMTLRFDPVIRQKMAEGYLGNLLAIEIRSGGAFLDRNAPLHWRQDTDISGVNIMSLGIWYEAVMRWAGTAKKVVAMGKTFTPMRRDENGFLHAAGVPEHLDVIADMACGAQLHLQISNVAGLAGPSQVWLHGDAGTLCLEGETLCGGRAGDKELSDIEVPGEGDGWRVEEEFVNAIRGDEKITHTTFEDGVKYMEFTEAVHRSMAGGHAVPLPLQDI